MLERHVRLRLQADTGTEDVGQRGALLGEGVDDGGARGREWRLEHVRQDAEDAVEALELVLAVRAPLDARHDLGDEDQVDDEGGS